MTEASLKDPQHKLYNTEASSAPRRGAIGVLPTAIDPETTAQFVQLEIAVHCPECSNYARIIGYGDEFRNVTKLDDPRFACSVCSWGPSPSQSPEQWQAYYAGRLGGTLIFAMNEEHMDVLVKFLETSPKRRGRVEFPWEYKALMGRLPHNITSGRIRNDMVSLLKKLIQTRPHGV